MAIGDEEMKIESNHSLLNSLSLNLDLDSLSPEDLEWADSCLNKDVDFNDVNWNSINDALLEILSSQPEPSTNFSEVQIDNQLENFRSKEIPRNKEIVEGSDKNENEGLRNGDFGEVDGVDVYNYDDDDDGDCDDENLVFRNKRGGVRGKILVDDVFRPNYSELKVENPNFDLDTSFTTNDVGPSSKEDIFKVWDLGISDDNEEDDFTKELNKALDGVPSQIRSITDDSTTFKDLIDVSIDDIISGIGDLSLKQ